MATEATVVSLKPINVKFASITIEGTSPLIQHSWDEKMKRKIREKKEGKKTKTREVCDPAAEAKAATYFTSDGKYGVPLLAIKSAIISAAHKDIGIEKTLVRKALFIKAPDYTLILPMQCKEPKIREDPVTVGIGGSDLRYRPQFDTWKVKLDFEFDADLLQPQDIVNLVNRAGFGIGIGEWRPEKGGEMGRFKVVE